MRGRTSRRLLGLAFFLVVVAFITLTIGQYQKKFETFTNVTFVTDSASNALPKFADVKARGLIVGRVTSVDIRGSQAYVHLGINADKAKLLPAAMTARILPKTLFGQRYVALQIAGDPTAGPRLGNDDTIRTDTSGNAIELGQLFDSLLPLLRAVPPQDLEATLGAVSNALQGNGRRLGTTLDQLNTIFTRVNASLPNLQESLQSLATVADTFSQALPDVITALDELRTTSNTLVTQRQSFSALWTTLTDAASRTAGVLEGNRSQLITIATGSRTLITTLADYSPEFQCTFAAFNYLLPEANRIVGKGTNTPMAHASLIVTNPRGRYLPNQDEPRWFDTRGPACYDVTKGTLVPRYPGSPTNDGSYAVPARNPGAQDSRYQVASPQYDLYPRVPKVPTVAVQKQNSAAVAGIYATLAGVPVADVPPWLTSIVSPGLRGTQVSLP